MEKLTEDGHYDNEGKIDVLEQDEEIEVGMVLDTNTVVDPLAMMIETFDALVADVAMSGVGCAEYFTVGAQQVRFEVLH